MVFNFTIENDQNEEAFVVVNIVVDLIESSLTQVTSLRKYMNDGGKTLVPGLRF